MDARPRPPSMRAVARARGGDARARDASRTRVFRRLLDFVTPAEAPRGGKGAYDAWLAGVTSGEVLACVECVEGTSLEGKTLEIVYDGARDGFAARTFHARADDRGPCVVVGITEGGATFGGFNPLGFYGAEDYRSTGDAFLVKWASEAAFRRGDAPIARANVLPGGNAAIFDFGAQGPCFGVDALRIPLGYAPPNGSSYAGVGGSYDLGKENAAGNRAAKSRLGTHYEGFPDGSGLFTAKEGANATLRELYVYASPELKRKDDGFLYVS